MDFSTLSMSGFEVLDSPATAKNSFLSLDEFEDASPLHQAYCQQMTEEDYHDQCIDTTEEAVNVKLISSVFLIIRSLNCIN